jgi:hypothetical protein
VTEVRRLFDESGNTLRAFVVHLEGLGRVLTSGDALTAAPSATPASVQIPRAQYADTSVPTRPNRHSRRRSPSRLHRGRTGRDRAGCHAMTALTTAQRDALPDRDFALVPIDTRDRAVAALGRAEQHASPSDQKTITAAVCRRYSDLPACQPATNALAAQVAKSRSGN